MIPLTASPPFLGFLWYHWDLRDCITTWCISWDFVISVIASSGISWDFMIITTSPRILWSSPPLLGFYDHHHLSWDFMIITTYITTFLGILWSSPPTSPASPPLLGFYDHHHLHHHLMHFLVFVILLAASPLDVPSYMWGCHHPLTNAKVRRKGTMRYRTFR